MKEVFNVRVYGILINEKNELLVSDEFHYEKFITKFPGGGLQFGEGTIECIKREMLEETGSKTEVTGHFYTTDFFQRSTFNELHQIISIYYYIRLLEPLKIEIKTDPFDFENVIEDAQAFRWVQLSAMDENIFTLPIDKKVALMLKQEYELRTKN
jgi:8-oxo-dGTP diphosphatase